VAAAVANAVQYTWTGVLPTIAVSAAANTITFTGSNAADLVYIYYLVLG